MSHRKCPATSGIRKTLYAIAQKREYMSKAVLLDLQGTLGGSGLDDMRTFSFHPFSIPAIKIFNEMGYLVIIITNQSHISKGEFTYSFFEDRMEELKQKVSQYGGKIDGIYCCPHTREDKCDCIKPLPGMVFRAKKDFKLKLSKCYVIGDSGGLGYSSSSSSRSEINTG